MIKNYLCKYFNCTVLVLLSDLEILFPPLFGVDQKESLALCVLAVLKTHLRCENIITDRLAKHRQYLKTHLKHACWYFALGAF